MNTNKKEFNMETNYNGTLVMPANYAVVDNDEMMYVDGGWCVDHHWWGFEVYLTHEERKAVTNGQLIVGGVAACVSAVGGAIMATIAGIAWNYDEGHGIRARFLGQPIYATLPTGIWSLSASEESGIASKNRVI